MRFVRISLHQKFLWIDSCRFESVERNRCWSESSLANRICWTVNKLTSVAKINSETILRTTKKNFKDEALPHELFLTTRQKIQ